MTGLFTMDNANNNIEDVLRVTKTIHTDTYPFISPKNADLSGRSVFISGASKGIGRQTALSYAAAGCSNIAIGARSDLSSLEHDIRQAAADAGRKDVPKVVSLKLDVTSEASVKAAADTVAEQFGGALDIMICNAGYLEGWNPVQESDPGLWWATYEVNVKGTYLCSRSFLPLLLRGTLKTLVLTTSYGALAVFPGASAYQSSKFAICRLAEFIAAEYKDQGLVCFSIHPGSVKTELAFNLPEALYVVLTDEPALSADTVVWLCKENRPWLNGKFVSVTWDMEELETKKDEVVGGDMFCFRMVF